MLVLSRKVGESIQISSDIRITVTQVRGGRVRLSIDAPPGIRIARQEILAGHDPHLPPENAPSLPAPQNPFPDSTVDSGPIPG
jgi:carbon storage regulator